MFRIDFKTEIEQFILIKATLEHSNIEKVSFLVVQILHLYIKEHIKEVSNKINSPL